MPILIPAPLLLAALLVPLVALWRPRFAFPLTLAAAAGSTSAAALALAHTVDGASLSYALGGWSPPLGIEYRVDRIGAFVVLVTLSVALVVLIAVRRVALAEFSDRLGPFYGLVLLMLAGVTGMVVTFDLFNLFVFIEISSVASYALVFMGGPRGMVAGFRYLLIGSIGGGFYLLGVGFIYFATGSVNMGDVATLLPGLEGSRAVLAGAVFIFVGLALKMALFPLHLWLPDAYAYAPSSVNSMIAPVMTKAAAFAMLRMFLSVFPPGYLTDDVPIAGALMVMGLLGMVIGSALAVAQRDFRRMLAFSSIGQLGIIGVGIGLATPLGAAAALLHIMNHAVMKACLFVVAAAVRFRTGRTDIAGMAGLGRVMPVTMAAFCAAALAMIGVPPLAGFFSKFYIGQAGAAKGDWPVVAVVFITSLFTAAYLFRVVERAYLGDASRASDAPPAQDPPKDMLVPLVVLAVAAIALGIANAAILSHVLKPGVLEWMRP